MSESQQSPSSKPASDTSQRGRLLPTPEERLARLRDPDWHGADELGRPLRQGELRADILVPSYVDEDETEG